MCLTARRMRYKIYLYPVFVVFPPPWQCVSVISWPLRFQAFGRVRSFANFGLLFLPHNTAHSPSVSLSLALLSAPRLTPTQGVTQSIQMCFALKPHYLAPVVLFDTIKRTGPSWECRASLCPPLPFALCSSVVRRWLRSYCEQASLVPLIPWVLFAYRLSLVPFETTQCHASSSSCNQTSEQL